MTLKEHVLKEFPNEACGIITTRGRFIPCKNIHKDPLNFFEMEDEVFTKYKIKAIIHSHPNGKLEPSAQDMQGQLDTDVEWGIVTTDGIEVSEVLYFGKNTPDLIGREFKHGVTDCYSLIRDWYKLEKDIELPEFPRSNNWWNEGENLYEEYAEEAGFRRLRGDETPQVGDVVLMAIASKVSNHGAILLDGGLLLHHLTNRLSRREPAAPWRKMFRSWWRYENNITREN